MFNASAIESNLFIVAFILAFLSLLISELSKPALSESSSFFKQSFSLYFLHF